MPELLLAQAHVRDLLASADWEEDHQRPWLDSTPADLHSVDVRPTDRGHSRGVLLADIKPIVDEEQMAG